MWGMQCIPYKTESTYLSLVNIRPKHPRVVGTVCAISGQANDWCILLFWSVFYLSRYILMLNHKCIVCLEVMYIFLTSFFLFFGKDIERYKYLKNVNLRVCTLTKKGHCSTAAFACQRNVNSAKKSARPYFTLLIICNIFTFIIVLWVELLFLTRLFLRSHSLVLEWKRWFAWDYCAVLGVTPFPVLIFVSWKQWVIYLPCGACLPAKKKKMFLMCAITMNGIKMFNLVVIDIFECSCSGVIRGS